MPAGGFKVFVDGEVLPASDINDYLMQGILVFSSEANRDAAIAGPDHGMFAFTTDNDRLWYYDGANWVEFSPDVEFASEAARDAAIPNPIDGRYAFTSDKKILWEYSGSDWEWQDATPLPANFSNSATGTYTSGGRSYKYVQFNSNGTLVCTQAGIADVLIVGGGGQGVSTVWNGDGGSVFIGKLSLTVGSHSVVVGAGGSGGSFNNPDQACGFVSSFFGVTANAGSVSRGQHAGTTSAITGSSITYGAGATSPTANRGEGGSQAGSTPGSSGVVVVRVETE